MMLEERMRAPAILVIAHQLRLVKGNRHDDKSAITSYRPEDTADPRAMPWQKIRQQAQSELSGEKKPAR